MKTHTLVATTLAGLVLAALGLGIAFAASAGRSSAETQARVVVGEFFQTINARRFARTCDLLSSRFYRENHVPDRRHCVLGLSVGFAMSPSVRFRIVDVRTEGDLTIVQALANGAAGRIVLVRETGGFKVLSVGS